MTPIKTKQSEVKKATAKLFPLPNHRTRSMTKYIEDKQTHTNTHWEKDDSEEEDRVIWFVVAVNKLKKLNERRKRHTRTQAHSQRQTQMENRKSSDDQAKATKEQLHSHWRKHSGHMGHHFCSGRETTISPTTPAPTKAKRQAQNEKRNAFR